MKWYPVKIKFRQKKHNPIYTRLTNFNFQLQQPCVVDSFENSGGMNDADIMDDVDVELTDLQQQLVMKWIDDNLSMIDTINKRNTIYEIIDAFFYTVNPDFKITTNQFSAAMLKAGFKMQDERFNVSGVSIKKLMHIIEKLHRLGNRSGKYENRKER